MTEIDHEGTYNIVCPHCGGEIQDSWEMSKNEDGASGDEECQECGKSFHWECCVSVTHSTSKIDQPPPARAESEP